MLFGPYPLKLESMRILSVYPGLVYQNKGSQDYLIYGITMRQNNKSFEFANQRSIT